MTIHQQSWCRKKKKKIKMKPVHHFEVGYIHHKLVKLFLAVDFNNVLMSNTSPPPMHLIFSSSPEFPWSPTKINHGFTTNKTKNRGSCSHGFVTLNSSKVYKEVAIKIIFCVVIKTDFWPPFCDRWQSFYNIFNKNMWTSQPLEQLSKVFFIVKLLNLLLHDFWMLETIKLIIDMGNCLEPQL